MTARCPAGTMSRRISSTPNPATLVYMYLTACSVISCLILIHLIHSLQIKVPALRRLTCQFKVRDDQIQVKIVKRSPRTTSARISEAALRS